MCRAVLETEDVCIGKPSEFLHTVTGGPEDAPPLVFIPGYAAGTGFLFRIFEGLTAGWRVFAVDPLGTGVSARPKFKAQNMEEAESFFIDGIEKWREKKNLDRFILVGHSLGGYLSTVYALRHPERVQHLVLICPAGVTAKPDDWKPPESVQNPYTFRGMLYRLARFAWMSNTTPGAVIRFSGPLGPGLVERYVRRRFTTGHHLNEQEIQAFHTYMYGILAAKGSGEFALRHILEPFAFPKQPLEKRMDSLNVPVTFIYGDRDWMDPKGAVNAIGRIKANRSKLCDSDLQILVTKASGHFPFLDQPGATLNDLLEACGHYLTKELRHKVMEVAAKYPLKGPATDTKEEMEKEMEQSPIAADARVASDM